VPELPDLVHVEAKLKPSLEGHRIVAARTGDPTVLRIMVRAPFPELLVGRTVDRVERRGPFICLSLGEHRPRDPEGVPRPPRRAPVGKAHLRPRDLLIAINAMLAGRYYLVRAGASKAPRALGLALELDDGTEMRFVDDKRMGKVYVAEAADADEIPILGALGLDPLSPELTLARFRELLEGRRVQVRQFLMDKERLASIGNAYADEILFAAKLHPKTFCNKLAPDEVARLHEAVRSVLRHAVDEIARRDPPIETKLRDFLSVRGRDGKPCPACGTTIRAVRVGDGDACFCPKCQPSGRKLFVDWGKLPR
jgi:formamidopyrimidine-DNA glycosylase